MKGLSQEALGARCGTGSSMISKYERDEADPTSSALRRLATALEVRGGYLLGEIDEYEGLSPREVAIRESLFFYLKKNPLAENERAGLMRVATMPKAPVTIDGWENFNEMTRMKSSTKRRS